MNINLEKTSLLLLFIIVVGAVFLSIAIGYALGNYFRRKRKGIQEDKIGSIVGALLGLLAFMLAFTFGSVTARYDAKKQLLLDEVNAIGTLFLRTDFLSAPEGAKAKALLKKYVDLRVDVFKDPTQLPQIISESEKIQSRLWAQVATSKDKVTDPILFGLYVQSLNEVIDFHTKRVTVGLQYRIPGIIWMTLYFITILAMLAVGYDLGLNGTRSYIVSMILALAFSAIIVLIADLDRGVASVLQVDHKPMIELQQKLNSTVN